MWGNCLPSRKRRRKAFCRSIGSSKSKTVGLLPSCSSCVKCVDGNQDTRCNAWLWYTPSRQVLRSKGLAQDGGMFRWSFGGGGSACLLHGQSTLDYPLPCRGIDMMMTRPQVLPLSESRAIFGSCRARDYVTDSQNSRSDISVTQKQQPQVTSAMALDLSMSPVALCVARQMKRWASNKRKM